MTSPRRDVLLVVGGGYHDVNRVLLTLLDAHDRAYVRVADTFEALLALPGPDVIVSHTCDVRPSEPAQDALTAFPDRGGRWFALHATNAFIELDTSTGPVHGDVTIPGRYSTPDVAPRFLELLGSRFRAHPSVQPFRVHVTSPEHPLVAGLDGFEVVDEAYCCELLADVEVQLHTTTSSRTMRRVPPSTDDDSARRPLLYLRRRAAGEVLCLTLGHARGRLDMQPIMTECSVERGPWTTPAFLDVVRRGLAWGLSAGDA